MHIFYQYKMLHNFRDSNICTFTDKLRFLTYLTSFLRFRQQYFSFVLYFDFKVLIVKNIYIYFLTASLQNCGTVIAFIWFLFLVIFDIFWLCFSTSCRNRRILSFSFLHLQKCVFRGILREFSAPGTKIPCSNRRAGCVVTYSFVESASSNYRGNYIDNKDISEN